MTNNIAKIRAALEQAGDYISSDLASERGAFEGYEGVSRIDEIKADLANNSAALAALAKLEKAAAEPVAWQYRLDGDCEWSQCTMRGFDTLVSIGECETRQLYTTPPPAPATPDQTLSALTAYKAQQGDEYVRMQAALQAAGESK